MRNLTRRDLTVQISGLAGAAALASLGLPGRALAQGATPVEGKDYNKLAKPVATDSPGKIEVIEFFWYSCPHCNDFEPTLEPWVAKLPPDVRFRRVPVTFDALKTIHAQIYYTWEALGLVEQMHVKTFNRFWIQHKAINREADMLDFAKESGLDVAKVKAAWESFGVQTRLRQANQLQQDYQIDHMPQVAVGGRYTTIVWPLPTTDFLIDKVRKGG
jgi:thiol:disulfide interchange protein DsbA